MIGHTIGFDLAILERQLAGCGLRWRRPRTLDTQLLAQLASPELGKCSLDFLAERFEIEPEGRHSAEGDAMLAAQIFLALVPATATDQRPDAGPGREGLSRADQVA